MKGLTEMETNRMQAVQERDFLPEEPEMEERVPPSAEQKADEREPLPGKQGTEGNTAVPPPGPEEWPNMAVPSPNNNPDQIKYRKYAYNMIIGGIAVIAFSVWSVIKAAFYLAFQGVDLSAFLDEDSAAFLRGADMMQLRVLNIAFAVIVFSFLAIDLAVRFYIGRSAIMDAQGRKEKSPVYIVLALMIGIGLINGMFFGAGAAEQSEAAAEVTRALSASRMVDLTSVRALVELAVSSILVRHYRRKTGVIREMEMPAGEADHSIEE